MTKFPYEAWVTGPDGIPILAKCDKCNRPRNSGNHDKCSRARQQEHAKPTQEKE